MTIAEIQRAGDGIIFRKNIERQERASFDYTQANLIIKGIGLVLGGKDKFPSLQEAYPEVFDKEEFEEVVQDKKDEASAARFIQFANRFNQNFKKMEEKNDG